MFCGCRKRLSFSASITARIYQDRLRTVGGKEQCRVSHLLVAGEDLCRVAAVNYDPANRVVPYGNSRAGGRGDE